MDDRESLIRLGKYLGVFKDSNIAQRLASRLEPGDGGKWLFASAEILKKILNRDGLEESIRIIRSTDYDHLSHSGSGKAECLARIVYAGLRDKFTEDAGFPAYDVFRPYFYQYLSRVETTLRGALYATGINKELVDLDNPLAFEAIAELRHIQGRRYGETSPLPCNVRQVTAVVRYVHILLDRYEEKCIGQELSSRVREILDKLSTYPGYYTMLEQRRKAEATRPLALTLEKLKDYPENEQDKLDLIVALSIILFNILPSLQLVRYIATLRPGPANRYLRHEYFAVLALNYLLTGKAALAEEHAEKACEVAPETNMKAYDCLLSGCIKIHLRDYKNAIKAFEAGLGLADRKTRSLIKFYTGVLQYEMGDAKLAIDSLRDARTGCADECDGMTLGNNIGTCYMALGNPEAALKAFEEAENSFPYTGRLTARQMRSVTYGNMGIVYMSLREFEQAASYFKKALRTSREAGNTRSIADQLMNIGLAAKGKKEFAIAANYFTSALNYSCSIDYVEGVLYSRDQLRQVLALDCRHGEVRPIERDIIKRHPRFSSLLMARRW